MSKLELKISVIIDAPVSKVWDALVNPEIVRKYFFGTELKSDFTVGSPIIFRGLWEGKAYEDKGTILEFEKEKVLRYNYWSNFTGEKDEPENYSNIRYSVKAVDQKTELTITQDNFKTQEAKEHSDKNWRMIIGNMKGLIESV